MRASSLRRADWALLGVLSVVVAVAYLLDSASGQELRTGPRSVVAVILALVPLVVWLTFFYQRDRIEPEPLSRVITVLGIASVGALVAEPLVALVSGPTGLLPQLVVASLWIGAIREWVKFAAVRLIAVGSGDVNELADGIVYGTAAGLGYATVLNLRFVLDATVAVDLGPGFLWMAVVALAHASFGGIVGYFLAADTLTHRPTWWMPLGLVVAAVADGLFFTLRSELAGAFLSADGGSAVAHWVGMAMAIALAAGVTYALAGIMAAEEPGAT